MKVAFGVEGVNHEVDRTQPGRSPEVSLLLEENLKFPQPITNHFLVVCKMAGGVKFVAEQLYFH